MKKIDITEKMQFGDIDGEQLPIMKCLCGESWWPWDGLVLSIYDIEECPTCHRKFMFSNNITIYEVVEDEISGN